MKRQKGSSDPKKKFSPSRNRRNLGHRIMWVGTHNLTRVTYEKEIHPSDECVGWEIMSDSSSVVHSRWLTSVKCSNGKFLRVLSRDSIHEDKRGNIITPLIPRCLSSSLNGYQYPYCPLPWFWVWGSPDWGHGWRVLSMWCNKEGSQNPSFI